MICEQCSKEIGKKEKYVLVGTYNMPKGKKSEHFFHFRCWIDHFNNAVSQKVDRLNILNKSVNFLNRMMGSGQAKAQDA